MATSPNTYWFSIAVGDRYKRFFADLNRTAGVNGIHIHCLDETSIEADMHPKFLKIKGILAVPGGYDRIAYIDADTLLVNPDGFQYLHGSLKEPWGKGSVPLLTRDPADSVRHARERNLWKVLRRNQLDEFCPGGANHRQEWNSGVITGTRDFMEELAREWENGGISFWIFVTASSSVIK